MNERLANHLPRGHFTRQMGSINPPAPSRREKITPCPRQVLPYVELQPPLRTLEGRGPANGPTCILPCRVPAPRLCSGGWIVPLSHHNPRQRQEEQPQPDDSLPWAQARPGSTGGSPTEETYLLGPGLTPLACLKLLLLTMFVPKLFPCFVSFHLLPPFNPISALLIVP